MRAHSADLLPSSRTCARGALSQLPHGHSQPVSGNWAAPTCACFAPLQSREVSSGHSKAAYSSRIWLRQTGSAAVGISGAALVRNLLCLCSSALTAGSENSLCLTVSLAAVL